MKKIYGIYVPLLLCFGITNGHGQLLTLPQNTLKARSMMQSASVEIPQHKESVIPPEVALMWQYYHNYIRND